MPYLRAQRMVRHVPLAALLAIVAAQDSDKHAAVNKVIKMLENLQEWCIEEGEKEAKSYNTFACYCKETTQEKSDAIQTGEDEKDRLTADIEDNQDKRDELDEDISDLVDEIAEAEKELKEATEEREETRKIYEKNEADLAGAIAGVEGAIEVMKAGKEGKLVQLDSVKKTLKEASLIADAMGLGGAKTQRVAALFLQNEAGVPSEDYSYHSNDIISTLEGLETDFKAEKDEVDTAEKDSVKEYKAKKKQLETKIKNKTGQMKDKKKERDEEIEKLAENSEELTASAAQLLDDQQYMLEVSKMCSEKAQTWDQRNKVRADELSALSAAIEIMKDKVKEKTSDKTVRLAQQAATVNLASSRAGSKKTMEEIEAEAESVEASGSALSFLQKRAASKPRALLAAIAAKRSGSPPVNENAPVINYLSETGKRLKSTLLTSLASQIRADPFAKIKKLIQELVERLLQEAADEANQKGFCDKALSDARQKRDYAAEEIKELNTEMSQLEALDDKLTEELDTLAKEIAELEDSEEETTKLRKEEKAENEATVEEAKAGLEAVEEAIDILDKFYKTASKEEVELEFVQNSGKGPADDAPDTGFDSGEAYTGNQGGGGGVLGMMDVIKSDFERTIKVTETTEEDAEDEYHNFMTENGKSQAAKNMATEQKTKQKDNAEERYTECQDELNQETDKIKTAISELLELQPTCIDTGMSYEDRVAAREDEIEALKKALCIFAHIKDDDPGASC